MSNYHQIHSTGFIYKDSYTTHPYVLCIIQNELKRSFNAMAVMSRKNLQSGTLQGRRFILPIHNESLKCLFQNRIILLSTTRCYWCVPLHQRHKIWQLSWFPRRLLHSETRRRRQRQNHIPHSIWKIYMASPTSRNGKLITPLIKKLLSSIPTHRQN